MSHAYFGIHSETIMNSNKYLIITLLIQTYQIFDRCFFVPFLFCFFLIFEFCRSAPGPQQPTRDAGINHQHFSILTKETHTFTDARGPFDGPLKTRKKKWKINIVCECVAYAMSTQFHRLIHNNLYIASISGVCTRSHTHCIDVLTISTTTWRFSSTYRRIWPVSVSIDLLCRCRLFPFIHTTHKRRRRRGRHSFFLFHALQFLTERIASSHEHDENSNI